MCGRANAVQRGVLAASGVVRGVRGVRGRADACAPTRAGAGMRARSRTCAPPRVSGEVGALRGFRPCTLPCTDPAQTLHKQ